MAKQKILIVDDEQLMRWALTEALRSWSYASVEASTGAAALAVFDTEQPSAVLLDVNLPDGSGLDVLREIKWRARWPRAKYHPYYFKANRAPAKTWSSKPFTTARAAPRHRSLPSTAPRFRRT